MNAQTAEIYGALLGDGCLSSYYDRSNKRQRYEINFSGSLDDFDYYKSKIQPYFKHIFSINGNLRTRKDSKAIIYSVRSKRVFDFFKELGFPVGKKQNLLKIPIPILANRAFSRACLMGLWNTDGSIYRRYTKRYKTHTKFYNQYFVMELKMKAKILLEQVKVWLDSNGISTSSITKNKNYVLRINSQNAINSFLVNIGFSNSRHLKRIATFRAQISSENLLNTI